jgi:hypothetical protein
MDFGDGTDEERESFCREKAQETQKEEGVLHCNNPASSQAVSGGAKVVENRRFEIPEKFWHESSVIGFRRMLPSSLEEGRRGFGWNSKKMEAEANGISNRRFSGSFVSPLAQAARL